MLDSPMISKKQKIRTQSADQARAEAGAVIDKALEGSAAAPSVKAVRKERLTKYPPVVREARDQNDARDATDGQRPDERIPSERDAKKG